MDHPRKVFIAGHRGLVGRALLKRFKEDESLVIIKATRGYLTYLTKLAEGIFLMNTDQQILF